MPDQPDSPRHRPPYRELIAPHGRHPIVLAGFDAFGDGTPDLYDSHPLHVALMAQIVELAGGSDLSRRASIAPSGSPETRLDELLVRALLSVIGTELSDESVVAELCRIRHGPALAAWVRGAASAVDVVEQPWLLGWIPLPERIDHPIAELEVAAWELVDVPIVGTARELAGADLHVGAVSDIAATVALAKRLGTWPGVVPGIRDLVGNHVVRSVWRAYRGPVLYVLERLAWGATLDEEELDFMARLLADEAYLKFVPGVGTNGSFTLAESFIDQPDDVRAALRELWRAPSADADVITLRGSHLRLLLEAGS